MAQPTPTPPQRMENPVTIEDYNAAQASILEFVDGAVQEYINLLDFIAPGTEETMGEFIRNTIGNALRDMVLQLFSPLPLCGAATELDYYEGAPT